MFATDSLFGLSLVVGFCMFIGIWNQEGNKPSHFPTMKYPEHNELTPERWELGRKLFFDPQLSRTGEVSCASCHIPEFAFSDTLTFSKGVENRVGSRNAPSLINIGYHPYFTRDGGVPTLAMQVLVPVQEHKEFDFNILKISDRLLKDKDYHTLSNKAYGKYPDAFVITNALACFERTLIGGNSRYDKYWQGDSLALNKDEAAGMSLFFSSRTNCSSCHGGFNFTDYSITNNGLQMHYLDSGRMRITKKEAHRDCFKVPSLRNIELTAPYMHDGRFASLEEVIEHYTSGIEPHKNLDKRISPISISQREKAQLKAFLLSLTDSDIDKWRSLKELK